MAFSIVSLKFLAKILIHLDRSFTKVSDAWGVGVSRNKCEWEWEKKWDGGDVLLNGDIHNVYKI